MTFQKLKKFFAELVKQTMNMGVDPNILVLSGRCPPEKVYWLNEHELKQYRVTWQPHTFTQWSIELYRDGLRLVSKSQDEKTMRLSILIRTKIKVSAANADDYGTVLV